MAHVRLSRPYPDYGVSYTARLPANRAVEGAAVQFQVQEAQTVEGQAIVAVKDQLRWKDFPYEKLPSSAVSREAAADLGTTAHMWLGSDFCARHILRNMDHLAITPLFWNREQTGAEGCLWLLFDHKYAYLRITSERAGTATLARMFLHSSARSGQFAAL